jgi:hypothetical protein
MSFIHFGCWNNGLCNTDENLNGLSRVMSYLGNYDQQVNFVVVAGDNYYDTEGKKIRKRKSLISQKKRQNNLIKIILNLV